MENQGIKLLYVSDLSWAYWFSKEGVKVPSYLIDKKIFTWAGNFEYEKVYREAGYRVVPLAGTELLSGLQTGLINTFSTVPLYALAIQTFGIATHMLYMKWGVLLEGVVIDYIGPIIDPKIKPELREIDNDYLENSFGDILSGIISCKN